MGYGLWAMGYGLWAMGYGLWERKLPADQDDAVATAMTGHHLAASFCVPWSHTIVPIAYTVALVLADTTDRITEVSAAHSPLILPVRSPVGCSRN
jgi:hypothetical protein